MADVKIRNIEKETVQKIDTMAAQVKLSREAYLRKYIRLLSISNEIIETEERYVNLVRLIVDVLQNNTERMDKLIHEIEVMGGKKID